jgi:hypothetical protein
MGVVGANFSIKENYLWIREFKDKLNIWPLLVPFSEIYLFSELPSSDTWESPNIGNEIKSKGLISLLLKNQISLSNIQGFPQMGSFSAVSKEVAKQILFDRRSLYVHTGNEEENVLISKPTKLINVNNVSETFRYDGTLRAFDNIRPRLIKESMVQYTKDNELLARAENVHSTILQELIDIFKKKGYDTLSNKFVDLFAHDGNRSYLLEVKSTENNNFRSQARKGIVQLFEYDYFEISKYVSENNLKLKQMHNIIVPSKIPNDNKYIDFINSLDIGVALTSGDSIKAVGVDSGITNI